MENLDLMNYDDIDREDNEPTLFDMSTEVPPSWMEHWQRLPEFSSNDYTAIHQITVSFYNKSDIKEFLRLIGHKNGSINIKGLSFPIKKKGNPAKYIWKDAK